MIKKADDVICRAEKISQLAYRKLTGNESDLLLTVSIFTHSMPHYLEVPKVCFSIPSKTIRAKCIILAQFLT